MMKLLLPLATILSISLAVLFGIDIAYRRQYLLDFDGPQNVLPAPEIADKYQIVKVGNSHSQDGISFEGYALQGLDLSGVAQKYETDLALLKHHRRQIEPNAIVLIPVTPISFSHTKPKNEKGFQALYYGRVSPLFIPNLHLGEYIESEFFSFVRVGYNWRQKYREEIRERIAQEEKWVEPKAQEQKIAGAEMPTDETKILLTDSPAPVKKLRYPPEKYYYHVAAIEEALASPSATPNVLGLEAFSDNVHFTYTKWLETDEFSQTAFAKNRSDLEDVIAYAQHQGWRPVLITIPITEKLQNALPADYMETYVEQNLSQVSKPNVPFFNFMNDKQLTTNLALFSNSDHLNHYGRAIMSYLLLQKLIENELVPQEVDAYYLSPLYEAQDI